MALDKYTRLKIAGNVLDETITDMAESWGVHTQTVRGVCDGKITSARVLQLIEEKIAKAEQVYSDHRQKVKAQTA